MGQTITEKILSRAAGRPVSPGEYIEVSSRVPITMGRFTGDRTSPMMKELGVDKLFDPNLIHFVDGHIGTSPSHNAGEARSRTREFGKRMGIPLENIFELGRAGIEHVVSGDNAWALPGEIFMCAHNNGHTTTSGALGAFAFPLTFGSNNYLITGKTWVRVPDSVKIVVNGKLPKGVVGRDVVEYALGQIGPIASAGKVIEWVGPAIDDMSIDSRFTLCCNALFFGAWTAIINPDQKCIEYVKSRNPNPFEPLYSDPDASYAHVFEIDVSNLVPQIVPPPERYHVHPVTQHEGKPINRGFAGSCANGRMEDMRMVAQVLKGRKIHPEVVFNITPGTDRILKQCVQEGLMEIFLEAEAIVPVPSCSMCAGLTTPLGAGDVCVATGTCNYRGRMGSRDAEIYLANAATVAASCVEGKIADPRKYL
ncbi:MAG: aconitase family protein [Chloroflexi bacterium]|nr:aconitase family protein [Chloroflexota bacterium]